MIRETRKQWPPVREWPDYQVSEIREILERLSKIEKKLGIKDCYEPEKDEFMDELNFRAQQISRS